MIMSRKNKKKYNIISIDVAIKSMGVCIVDVIIVKHELEKLINKFQLDRSTINKKINLVNNEEHEDKIKTCYKMIVLEYLDLVLDNIRQFKKLFMKIFDIKYVNSFDLVPEYKSRDIEAKKIVSSRLKGVLNYITTIDRIIHSNGENTDIVMLEYQMNLNDKSRQVCSEIKQYFSSSMG